MRRERAGYGLQATGYGQGGSLVVWLIAAAILVSGCTGSLLETDLPANTQYVLAPATAAAPAGIAATQADLSIGQPVVAPGLDTTRIAVLKGQQLDYYRAAMWGGSTGDVVQSLLVGTFEEQKLFRSVTPEQARVSGNYFLDLEVRDFQAEYGTGGAPTVHVHVIARLIRVSDRKLVETLTAEARSTAGDDRMGRVAASFQTAAQQVALDLASKVAGAIAREPTMAPRTAADP